MQSGICTLSVHVIKYSHGKGKEKKPQAKYGKGERNMENGLNSVEMQELKAALLKADRLETLAILRECATLEEAIKALQQRLRG